jgi:CheY-like chemotaxis protein
VLGNSDAGAGEAQTAHMRPGDIPRPAADREGLRVLVVDDDLASLDATFELLMLIGMCPECAASAAQALNALDGDDFDVLLTDVVMPGMSGAELARRAFDRRPEPRDR